MPIALPPADVPYAYVVDYRPLDACAPPACRLKGEELVGWWDEVQSDGGRGSYARVGTAATELYFRRARDVRPGRSYTFELAPASGEYEYDGYFAAPPSMPSAAPDGTWRAAIQVELPDGSVLLRREFEGRTKPEIDARDVSEMARYADYFSHVRFSLPPRDEPVTVRIENTGTGSLAVGSPLVLKKVMGRRPRQAIMVVADAVPEPLMSRMLTGSGDEQTKWLSQAVRERGSFFARGTSPGFNSPTFIRRFFRSGFYETDGEPALFGQGIDEQPPATPPSPLSRLVERGFQAELTMANFMLLPSQTRLGFDGGYHNEQQAAEMLHPPALVRRFSSWIAEHSHDDAFHVVWFSSTHEPFPPGREAPPFELGASGVGYSQRILDGIWRNLLDVVDHLRQAMDRANEAAPNADRLWLFTTDHGRNFTSKTLGQAVWLPPDFVYPDNTLHCCVATFEEAHTPFAVLYDGAARKAPARVEEPTSTVAFWRLLEHAFGEDLELPNTRTFDSPSLTVDAPAGADYQSRWDEGLLASAGNAGSIRAVSDRWAFRSLLYRPQTSPLFTWPLNIQRALTGSPHRGDYFLAEELYDRTGDPYELRNVADRHESTVLEFRRKLVDWVAVYYDPPSHPRYEYSLTFPERVELTFKAPQPLRVAVDGAAPSAAAYSMTLKGTRFVIQPDAEAPSIVDIEGAPRAGLVRCAATGLPLEVLGSERVRFNLALARTNCVATNGDAELGSTDVGFQAKLVKESIAGSASGMTRELMDGLRSWGYVRDLDQAHGAKRR